MTTESKILTVSYGTFSCTLEGFDDPFNTMKAIAEYFRDLAAEDRYFGAEPSQPDAAMLHRVAEREVARLVANQSQNGGIALSAARTADPDRVTGRIRTPRDPASGTGNATAVAEPVLQEMIPGGVAAKLARIRQSVTPEPAAAALAEDVLRSLDGGGFAPQTDRPATDDPADLAALDMPVGKVAGDTSAKDALSRLGALIADPEAEETAAVAPPEGGPLETLPFDSPPPETLLDAPNLPTDEPVNLWHADDTADDSDLTLAEDLAEDLTEDTALEDGLTDQEPVALDADPVQDGAAAAAVLADVTALSDAAADAVENAFPDDTVPVDAAPSPAAADVGADPVAAPDATKKSGKSRRVSSRVVRIHPDGDEDDRNRPDAGATRILSPSGEDAEVARLLRQADDVLADSENLRRIESIAHLKAAVAATEADRSVTGEAARPTPGPGSDAYRDDLAKAVQPEPEPSPASPTEVRPRRKTVSVRPQEPRPGTIRPGMISPTPLVLVSEQRIDRIVPAEAPAAAFDAAAVAPTPQPAPETPSEVTPIQKEHGLPGIEGTPLVVLRTGRLTGAIGMGAAAAVPAVGHQTVALERILHSPATELDDDDDFDEDLSEADEAGLASFAERVGVKSMADMLEAAAAYATCIEKRDRFTRPQLMRRLMASAGGKPISREDGLRSFGTLLRTGRIEKISRGHYALAEHSPYLAEARRPN